MKGPAAGRRCWKLSHGKLSCKRLICGEKAQPGRPDNSWTSLSVSAGCWEHLIWWYCLYLLLFALSLGSLRPKGLFCLGPSGHQKLQLAVLVPRDSPVHFCWWCEGLIWSSAVFAACCFILLQLLPVYLINALLWNQRYGYLLSIENRQGQRLRAQKTSSYLCHCPMRGESSNLD